MLGLEKYNYSQVNSTITETNEYCSDDYASVVLKYGFQILGVEECNYNETEELCHNNENKGLTSDGLDFSSFIYPILLWIRRCTASIGGLGLIANFAAIIILLRIKSGILFNRSLAILAIIGGRQVKFAEGLPIGSFKVRINPTMLSRLFEYKNFPGTV